MSEWMTNCFLGLTKAIPSSSESVTWVLEVGVAGTKPRRDEVDWGDVLVRGTICNKNPLEL